MRHPENGWYEENDYISICIAFAPASFRKKKHKKPSATAVRYHFLSFMTQSCISLSKINDAAHMLPASLKTTGRSCSHPAKTLPTAPFPSNTPRSRRASGALGRGGGAGSLSSQPGGWGAGPGGSRPAVSAWGAFACGGSLLSLFSCHSKSHGISCLFAPRCTKYLNCATLPLSAHIEQIP